MPFPQGTLYSFAIEPGTHALFAYGYTGTAFALRMSADGATWSPPAVALPTGFSPYLMAFAPDGTLFALDGSGVRRLAAGAWSAAGTGIPSLPVYGFAFHPTDPAVAYAAGYSSVYKTLDGGATWAATNFPSATVQALWLDPAAPDTLRAGVSGGVRTTTDGGASWSATVPLDTGDGAWVLALVGAGPALVAGTTNGVFKSADAGATWPRSCAGLRAPSLVSVAAQPGGTGVLLAGGNGELFRSADGGASWTRTQPTPGSWIGTLIFDAATPARVWMAAGYFGVQRSIDGGVTWAPTASVSGLITGLTACRAVPDTLWVATTSPAAVHRTTNGGTSWSPVFPLPSASGSVTAVAAHPTDPLVAFAGYQDYSASPGQSGVYRTIDGGASWTRISTRLVGQSLAVADADPSVLWSGQGDMARSADGGVTWTSVYPPGAGQLSRMALDPANPLRLLTGSLGSGIWVTTDGGATWASSRSGLGALSAAAVAIDPAAGQTVYAGTGGGLLRSTTGGF